MPKDAGHAKDLTHSAVRARTILLLVAGVSVSAVARQVHRAQLNDAVHHLHVKTHLLGERGLAHSLRPEPLLVGCQNSAPVRARRCAVRSVLG